MLFVHGNGKGSTKSNVLYYYNACTCTMYIIMLMLAGIKVSVFRSIHENIKHKITHPLNSHLKVVRIQFHTNNFMIAYVELRMGQIGRSGRMLSQHWLPPLPWGRRSPAWSGRTWW